jgi:ribosomal protein S18 acetylase RimI-like enzyme
LNGDPFRGELKFDLDLELDPGRKSTICEEILRALPEWFGLEEGIRIYLQGVRDSIFFTVSVENRVVGFCAVKIHFQINAELYVLGLRKEFHGQRIGTRMIEHIRQHCKGMEICYMTVKTVSGQNPDIHYAKSRRFYEKMGFQPLEVFPGLWDENNPCLYMIREVADH